MPDITAPASLSYSAGGLRGNRIAPARLTYSAGIITASRDTPLTAAAEIPKLDRLRRFDKLSSGDEIDPRFQLIWQRTMEAIESAFEAVNARVDEVAILARISAVEDLAEVANDNAVAAQITADKTTTAVSQTLAEIDPIYQSSFDGRLEP